MASRGIPRGGQATEVMAPTCWDQLTSFHLEDQGSIAGFDNGLGKVYITEGSNCWDELLFAYEDMRDFMEE